MSPGIELVAYAGPRSSSTASSLSYGCTIDPGLDEPGEVCIRVELCLLDFARVNDVYDIVDSDRCLVGVLSIASYMKVEIWRTSATLVAATIFHDFVGRNTLRCSLLERLACSGRTIVSLSRMAFRIVSTHCRISLTPGRNISMPPLVPAVLII